MTIPDSRTENSEMDDAKRISLEQDLRTGREVFKVHSSSRILEEIHVHFTDPAPAADDRMLMEGYLARHWNIKLPWRHRYSNRWPRIFTGIRMARLRKQGFHRGASALARWGR